MKTAVIAIGGNAILPPGSGGSAEDQRRRVPAPSRVLADLMAEGYDIALTHGNGPGVGNALPRHEAGRRSAPPMPLDVCVAETPAEVGYGLQQELRNELGGRGVKRNVNSPGT